jgi:hypothetical protein
MENFEQLSFNYDSVILDRVSLQPLWKAVVKMGICGHVLTVKIFFESV